MKYIKELPFIFMQSFNLNIKNRIWVDLYAVMLFDILSQSYFIPVFYLHKFLS